MYTYLAGRPAANLTQIKSADHLAGCRRGKVGFSVRILDDLHPNVNAPASAGSHGAPILHFLQQPETDKLLMAPCSYSGTFPNAFVSDVAAKKFILLNRSKLKRLGALPVPIALPATSKSLNDAGSIWLHGFSKVEHNQHLWKGAVKLGRDLAAALAALEAQQASREPADADAMDLDDQGHTYTAIGGTL